MTVRAGDRGVQIPYSEGASVEMRLVDEEGEPVHFAEVLAGFDWASPEIPRTSWPAGSLVWSASSPRRAVRSSRSR